MKKIIATALVLIILTALPVFADKKATDRITVENNIKILTNALELYANDHYREYPSESEFYSDSFDKYIIKALGGTKANTGVYYKTPPAGKIDYKRSARKLNYKLSCPNPETYGLKMFYYSPLEGFVKNSPSERAVTTGKDNGQPIVKRAPEKAEENVADAEKQEMLGLIKDLHRAYKARDLEGVMALEKEAIVRAGLEMEKRGKYTAIEVYYAFKGTANDLFRAPGYGVEPLETKEIKFRKKGNLYQAYSSDDPIIATNQVEVGTMKVRLKIGMINFEKDNGKFRIVKVTMY